MEPNHDGTPAKWLIQRGIPLTLMSSAEITLPAIGVDAGAIAQYIITSIPDGRGIFSGSGILETPGIKPLLRQPKGFRGIFSCFDKLDVAFAVFIHYRFDR